MYCVVYQAPNQPLTHLDNLFTPPHLAVLFDDNGEIISTDTFDSKAQAIEFCTKLDKELHTKTNK